LTLAADLRAAVAAGEPYPAERFAGRGIVICAGGARFFTCAWVAIGILRRHLGCTLPIEVWYLGAEEMSPAMRSLLEGEGAQPIDAFEVARRHPSGRFDGWDLKPYALLHSRFREVLLLDADNVPVRDPSFLFDRPDYAATGALFWPDIVRIARNNGIWALTGLDHHAGPSFESGQLLVDKARCWEALKLTLWINQRAEAFYALLYCDKDTFLIAWLLTRTPYGLVPHAPQLIEGTVCQRDPDGVVLFQHRNSAKWILFGSNPVIEGFQLEAECRALLRELTRRWDGHVFRLPTRGAACREAEAALARQRRFRLIRLGDRETPLDLTEDHQARHAGALEFYWHVEQGDAGLRLVLSYAGLRCCALARDEDGVWRGDYERPPYMPVLLAPAERAVVPAEAEDPLEATELADRLLALYSALPWDRETARDFAGAVRSLALLSPAMAERFRAAARAADGSPLRLALAEVALDALAPDGTRSDGALKHHFSTFDYERL
jgi:hypothetical protein